MILILLSWLMYTPHILKYLLKKLRKEQKYRNMKKGRDRSQVEGKSTKNSQSPVHFLLFITGLTIFFSKNTPLIY